MTRRSLESERPIMAPSLASKRTSVRFSTYSASPSFASERTAGSTDTVMAEIKELTEGLDRLENKPLQQQRFVPSAEKTENLSKLALGAKVDRALGRRMTGQDAVMKQKPVLSEKGAMEETVTR
ncbi:MAG: hypothetical protein Q9227_007503 [Pyrenula ochraceoflavens]